jgi:hypothetical protein
MMFGAVILMFCALLLSLLALDVLRLGTAIITPPNILREEFF